MKNWTCGLLMLMLATPCLGAEVTRLEPVVVTATRTATPLSQTASTVTIVTAEEIAAQQLKRVSEVLRRVPGVNLTEQGAPGGNVSVFLRGTDNKHTLVLIDGMEFRDPANIGGGPNLANLTTDNIEQIEIVRGAQSVLYGSDAIGGVINIITRKGTSTPQAYAQVEAGSFATNRQAAGFSAANEKISTAISLSRSYSDGFSTFNEEDGFREDDGYKNASGLFNLGLQPHKLIELDLNLRATKASYDYDTDVFDVTTGAMVPTEEGIDQDSRDLLGRFGLRLHLLDERWLLNLAASRTETERDYWDGAAYSGAISKYELQSVYTLNQQQILTAGLEWEKESFDNDYFGVTRGSATTKALFIQDQYLNGPFQIVFGVRLDEHEEFGGQTTWRLAPAYTLATTGTRLKGSLGTGFKAPSLYQLYSSYGNQNIQPEESLSWDIGIEQPLFNGLVIFNLTWFANDIEDYIDYDYATNTYQNISSYQTQGLETSFDWYPADWSSLRLSYTYTDSEDDTGARLARRPLHQANFDWTLSPLERLQLNLNARYISERYDSDYTGETLDAYTLVNLASSYQLNETVQIFSRVDNLFDENYEEIAGYGTAGLSAYAGIKATF